MRASTAATIPAISTYCAEKIKTTCTPIASFFAVLFFTMELEDTPDQYFTCDGRLASFQITQPATKRKSNAKGKAAKTLAWPHRDLDPESLARAGFYFDPTPEYPDNTVCFLCSRKIGGWEEGDNPFEEHLRLSPHCGWAIVAAIEVGLGDHGLDDPTQPRMIEARKATFGGRWPHEGKRGWKCKTKQQLVDAGWKYTPTMESDDMATCTYCQLALDGWEPKDDPMHEHYKRSPECQYFRLISMYQKGPTKKAGRGKGARTSKASRLSTQSVTTAASDGTLPLDHPAELEDSVMTTTSVMTQGGAKRGRAKKATTARGKKARTKKEEIVQVHEDPPETQEENPQPPAKPNRGRKRGSDAVEDSVMTIAEAPPLKKRAIRGRRSNTADASMVDQQIEDEMAEEMPAPLPKTRGKKGRPSNARTNRKASATSTVSTTSLPNSHDEHLMDDEELNRQLEADLDRPLSDDENIAADSDSERKKMPVKVKAKTAAKKGPAKSQQDQPSHHPMFDPTPAEIDEAAVDAELKVLEAEMETEPAETIQVPKKGRKAGTRKVSKQTTKKAQKPAPVEPGPEPESAPEPNVEAAADVDELAEGHEDSMMSNATVMTKRTSSASEPLKKKRGRPSKKTSLAKAAAEAAAAEPVPPAPAAKSSPKTEHFDFAEPDQRAATPPPPAESAEHQATSPSLSAPQEDEAHPPSTPGPQVSSTPAAKQATISPSQSPQSSDAENQPPSSRPSNATNNNSSSSRSRVAPALAPPVPATTPARTAMSPSKGAARNVLGNLQTTHPWTGVDLDVVFDELEKENQAGSPTKKYLGGGGGGGVDLTSPERRMTVEEWIYHNAGQAEQRLRFDCEAMVTAFEREGSRAMMALEGLVAE
ncbi:hypothetical protein DL764_001159 [Monosporascus ibericus]|uniref:BIR-domain-containing protein n=1 Tax=Monosporascus ibericus TaxID=155417 RepID=A0A4Q4TU16_9PEZI|nr:hypothetical protein DL764_001159 [Monosporascus ibericus]